MSVLHPYGSYLSSALGPPLGGAGLRYSIGSILELEDRGINMLRGVSNPTTEQALIILWIGLNKSVPLEDISGTLTPDDLATAFLSVGKAILAAFGIPETASAPVKKKAGKNKDGEENAVAVDLRSYWPLARMRMKLSEEEFLSATYAEFLALYEEWLRELENEDRHWAELLALTFNIAAGSQHSKKVEAFLPQRRGKKADAPQKQTVAEQVAIAESLTRAYGGRDLRKK